MRQYLQISGFPPSSSLKSQSHPGCSQKLKSWVTRGAHLVRAEAHEIVLADVWVSKLALPPELTAQGEAL